MAINNFNVGIGTTSQLTRYRYVATGGETSISGADADGKTLSYTVGLEQVYLNGVNLVRGQDYTATNGTSVGSLTALVASDVVEVFAYVPFNIANALTVSTVDAKGDLLVGTGADAVGRLAVGSTNGQLLSVDSSTASGMAWVNPGLTLISTTSFSAVGTASLPTSTFTSTYDNYRLIIKISATTSDSVLYMKMRASGTDSSAGYYYAIMGLLSTPATANKNGENVTTGIFLQDLDTGSSAKPTWSTIDIFTPQIAQPTLMNIQSVANSQTGTPAASVGMGYHTPSTAYDSVTLVPSAGNISGSIVVYGYNK
jgi:hypothetical protein